MTTLTDNQGRSWEAVWVMQGRQGGRIAVLMARAAGDRRPMRRMVPDDQMARQILAVKPAEANFLHAKT